MKIAIIGLGHVGSTAAYTVLLRGIADVISLFDVDEKKVHRLPAAPEHERVIAYLDKGDEDYFERLGQLFYLIEFEVERPGEHGVRAEEHDKGQRLDIDYQK